MFLVLGCGGYSKRKTKGRANRIADGSIPFPSQTAEGLRPFVSAFFEMVESRSFIQTTWGRGQSLSQMRGISTTFAIIQLAAANVRRFPPSQPPEQQNNGMSESAKNINHRADGSAVNHLPAVTNAERSKSRRSELLCRDAQWNHERQG